MSERPKESTFEEVAAGYWKRMKNVLPNHFTEKQESWLKNYLQAQVALFQKDFTETRKILTRLDADEGYLNFEEAHQSLFAALDVVARGKTSRDPIKPLFTREDLPNDETNS